MNYELKLKTPFLGADGKSIQGDPTLNTILSQHLMGSNESVNALKFFDWAIKLHNDGSIIVDETDKETLRNFIKNHQQLTVLAKGRLLEAIAEGKSK